MRHTLIVFSLLALSLGLASAATLTGKVVGMNGKPIHGAHLLLDLYGEHKTPELRTDAGGVFVAEVDPALLRPDEPFGILAYAPGYALTENWIAKSGEAVTLYPGATISGTVVDAKGKPLAGVPVRLLSCEDGDIDDDGDDADPVVPEEWRARFTVHSAADGSWTLSGIPQEGEATIALDDARYVHEQRAITLVAGKKAQAVRFIVRPGAVLTGRVLTPEGAPAAGACVACSPSAKKSSITSANSGSSRTAADGSYRLTGLAAGVYSIRAESPRQAWVADPLQDIQLAAGARIAAPDLRAHMGAVLDGMVQDAETGAPIPDVQLTLYRGAVSDNKFIAAQLRTDIHGHFFYRTQPQAMRLLCTHAQRGYLRMQDTEAYLLRMSEGSTSTVVVKLQKGLTLTGTVTDTEGRPAVGAVFSFFMQFSKDGAQSKYDIHVEFTTDEQGKFAISALPVGKAILRLLINNERSADWEDLAPLTIDVPEKEPFTITLNRIAWHTLRGRVVDARQRPVAGVTVNFLVSYRQTRTPQRVTAMTGADGGYQLAKIPAGRKVVQRSLVKDGYCQPLNITLPEDGKDTFDDVVLGDALLDGAVQDVETGKPLPGASVVLYHNNILWDNGRTDEHGHFFYRGQPMQLTLLNEYPPQNYLGMKRSEALQVNLQAGKTATVVVKLRKGLTLTGTVTSEEGKPLAGMTFTCKVPFRTDGTWNLYDTQISFTTDQHGKFTISGLPAGKGALLFDIGDELTSAWRQPTPLPFAVPAQAPITVTLLHTQWHTVRGRVLDTRHHPLAGVTAILGVAASQGDIPQQWRLTRFQQQDTSVTGVDGRYQLAKIPAGYDVSLCSVVKTGYRQLPIRMLTSTDNDTIEDAVMAPCTATVDGKVCDPAGKPVPGAVVLSVEGGRDLRAVTDTAGAFTLEKQPEGELHLVAATPTGGGVTKVSTGTDALITCTPGRVAKPDDSALAQALLDADGKLPKGQRRFDRSAALRKLADVDLDLAWQLAQTGDEPVSDSCRAYLLARKAAADPAKIDNILLQLTMLKNADCKRYAAAEIGIAETQINPELAEQLYLIAKPLYERSTHDTDAQETDELGNVDDTITLAGLLHKQADVDVMLDRLNVSVEQQENGNPAPILWPLFQAAGRVSPEFVFTVYDHIGDTSKKDALDQSVLGMAQRDPDAALRLLKMVVAKTRKDADFSVIVPLINALGKKDPASALALAQAQPENMRASALLAAATWQEKAAAETLVRGVFATGSNQNFWNLARVNAFDPELAKELYMPFHQHLQPEPTTFDYDSIENCLLDAYLLSSIDPQQARLILETEYVRALSRFPHGDYYELRFFPLAMCALDLDRAQAMIEDIIPRLNDLRIRPYFQQPLMRYILMSREERVTTLLQF